MTAVPAPKTCPLCREPIPEDAPSGACPKCLLGAGVPTGGKAAEAAGLGAADVAAKFPDYEVLGFLGRGGMGVVWKARHRALDRVVALKVLPADVARAPGFAERFQREARALARLAHPNIVGVHEVGEREGTYFLVMEFVDGVNMRQALREGRIGARDVLRVVPQICDALQYAHDHGVVHRDIKPENVLVAADGRVKVADFGLAKIVGGDTVVDLTLPGQVMGTPAYMAPEQVERPTSVDHRADIYSLGVVFYEMLTGELPLGRFEAPSKRVQVDVRFDEVVLRSLEKQPERRWQHAAEVKEEVGAIAAAPVAAPAAAPVQSPRTNRLAVVSLVLALAALPVAFFGAAALGRANPWAGLPVALGGAFLLSAFVGGIVSWVQIARSKGAERGLGYAIPATIVALVLPCLASPLVYVLGERETGARDVGPRIEVPFGDVGSPGNPGLEPTPPVTIDRTEHGFELHSWGDWPESVRTEDAWAIRDLWAQLVAAHPVAAVEAGRFYSKATWRRLDVVGRWPQRSAEFLAGTAGLPLMDPNLVGGRIAECAIERVEVFRDRSRGHLRVASPTRTLRVPIERTGSHWWFAAEPVLVEGK